MIDIETFNLMSTCKPLILVAYLIGAISPGYLLVRILKGVDVRKTGSGSIGARNVGRILGKKGFYFTLFADIGKGAAAVYMFVALQCSIYITASACVAVIAGHVWPLWLGFKGGKGIATSIGAFAVLDYTVVLLGSAMILSLYVVTRRFLLSWLISLWALPLILFSLDYSGYVIMALILTGFIIVIAHKDNINEQLLKRK